MWRFRPAMARSMAASASNWYGRSLEWSLGIPTSRSAAASPSRSSCSFRAFGVWKWAIRRERLYG